MDLATIIGLILAWSALLVSFSMEGGHFASLLLPAPALLVIGGTIGVTMASFSLKHSISIPIVLKQAFFNKHINRLEMLQLIVSLAKRARQAGILALEAEIANIASPFLRQAVQLVVDGTQPELVREILETEIEAMSARHKGGEEFFTTLGGYGPTLGIIGTVMGLIHMLENLDEPGGMGPAIAAAFLATLYGVCTANMIYLPIAAKLKTHSHEEVASYEMAVEGILSLQAGDNPRVVAVKMRSFLSPEDKRKLDVEEK